MDFDMNPGDDALLVTFFTKAVESKSRSREAGHAVFVDMEYVRIMTKGEAKSIVERKAADADKKRFPRQYDAYKRGCELADDGLPLEEWSFLTASRVMTLKAAGFRTVEDIAKAQDNQLAGIGFGARELIDRAKAALQPEADTVKELRAEIRKLKRELKNVTARLEAATSKLADADELEAA